MSPDPFGSGNSTNSRVVELNLPNLLALDSVNQTTPLLSVVIADGPECGVGIVNSEIYAPSSAEPGTSLTGMAALETAEGNIRTGMTIARTAKPRAAVPFKETST
jgi:hypothetical protein